MRIVIEYEEKALQEDAEQEGMFDGFRGDSYRASDKLGITNGPKLPIPGVMKRLYPNINEERYYKLKSNVSLMNMMVKLCENCYLEATENIIETKDDRKAKNTQVQIREKVKKNASKFGVQNFPKDVQSPVSDNRASLLSPKTRIETEKLTPTHPHISPFQGSKSHRVQSQMSYNKPDMPAVLPQTAKTSRIPMSENKPPLLKLGSEENDKVILPFIVSAKHMQKVINQVVQAPTKNYYFRAAQKDYKCN